MKVSCRHAMITQSLIAYIVAASVLVVTPGLDTALILRAAAVEGSRTAFLAACGVALGCLCWGAGVALGLGALITASPFAFECLKWIGAAYLFWLGVQLILRPRRQFLEEGGRAATSRLDWFWRGMFGNLLNPKAGMFYVAFLPQFVPDGVSVAGYTLFLAVLHVLLGFVWFSGLIVATQPLGRALRRPSVALDRLTGCVFLGFGVKLALSGASAR